MTGGTVSQITPAMIKELREKTGVGMAKCKSALVEAGGDVEQAVVLLRKAGMASAAKKEGRQTKEGAIGVADGESTVALIEVNSETDFVANNDIFKNFLSQLANEVASTKPDSAESFLQQKLSSDEGMTIDEYRSTVIQKIGENIQVRRVATFAKGDDRSFGVYSHMGGKIVAIVEIAGSNEESELARNIAMHVAASQPQYLNPEAIPASVTEQELEIAREQVKGKPENIMEKILEGKLRAFHDQVCLVAQKYVRDDKVTIQQLVDAKAKESGKTLSVASFTCWKVGE